MASGLPDYQRTVRTLPGRARHVFDYMVIDANAVTTLLTITGKGIIYGGVIIVDFASTQAGSTPLLYVDGEAVANLKFQHLYLYKINKVLSNIMFLLAYDDTSYIYSVGISPGVTFENSLELRYNNIYATTPDVGYGLVYALIT
jgi:hypothetical protein